MGSSVELTEKGSGTESISNGVIFIPEVLDDEDEDDVPFVSSFEKLLEEVVSNGFYQKRLIVCFMVPLALIYGIASGNVVLLMQTPQHTCHVPGRSEANVSFENWKNVTIPWEEGPSGEMELSKCKMYNESFYDNNLVLPDNLSLYANSIVECQHGWDYGKSKWAEIPVTKFDWVCNKKKYVTYVFTLGMVAAAIGTVSLSLLSDRFGRKPIFAVTIVVNLTFGLALIFSQSFIQFGIFKFLSALSFYAMYQLPYIIVIEISSHRLRSIATTCSMVAFIVATCYNVLMAHLLSNWKMYILSTQLPVAIFIFYIKFIPESPRWLLAQGKLAECEKVLTKITETNGGKFTDEMRLLIVKAQEEEKKKVSPTKILTSFVLTKHLLLTGVLMSLNLTVLISLNLNVHNMRGNLLINYLVIRVMELPGNILAGVSCNYIGRRTTAVVWPLLAGATLLAASFLTAETWALTLVLGITKMFIKFPFFAVYMQIGEMFPTSLRATAYGATGVMSMLGPIASPSLIALGSVKAQLPYYIMFGIIMLVSLISTFLPETLGQPLPQTLKEAKNVGKGQSYFTVITKWSAYKAVPREENTGSKTLKHNDVDNLN